MVEETGYGQLRVGVFPDAQIIARFACVVSGKRHRQGGRPSPGGGDGWTREADVATMAPNEEVRLWARWAFGS